MGIEEISKYGNSFGGLIIVLCLIIFIIISKQLGKDERSNAIFLKVYSSMFYVFSALILLSVFFRIGKSVTGLVYQNMTVSMFAFCVVFGTIYLFVLKKKY
ncbi:hypothetical protein [Priestia megaterium]|uniref:hypothetical protein n=1 Tax=Priestia megaterium TaxID=1404 RepID=UPI002E1ABEF3|nr:hypothetical protein [Priestia megaterium]